MQSKSEIQGQNKKENKGETKEESKDGSKKRLHRAAGIQTSSNETG